MKKNKTIAYMLAATLLVGGTFVGTKALFTDKVDAVTELAISTGDVDIVEVDKGALAEWMLDRNGAELSDGTNISIVQEDNTVGKVPETSGGEDNNTSTKQAFANNLKPGDKLTKTVTIRNDGTLVATEINVQPNTEVEGNLNELFEISHGQLEKTTLNPGQETTFTLNLTVKNIESKHDKTANSSEWNSDNKEDKSFDLTNAWILSAKQQNSDNHNSATK